MIEEFSKSTMHNLLQEFLNLSFKNPPVKINAKITIDAKNISKELLKFYGIFFFLSIRLD